MQIKDNQTMDPHHTPSQQVPMPFRTKEELYQAIDKEVSFYQYTVTDHYYEELKEQNKTALVPYEESAHGEHYVPVDRHWLVEMVQLLQPHVLHAHRCDAHIDDDAADA